MKVLIACEFSGVVRNAFVSKGHYAVSCDLLPSELPVLHPKQCGEHIQGDVLDLLKTHAGFFDLMIAHPPCTHLAVSGARYFPAKIADGRQGDALDFVRKLMASTIPRICIENPISIISSKIRKPDQIIQPWMFGHETTKATCLWLKNLPKLQATNIVSQGERQLYASGKSSPMWHAKSGGGCGKSRSITFAGIAAAMAAQWG